PDQAIEAAGGSALLIGTTTLVADAKTAAAKAPLSGSKALKAALLSADAARAIYGAVIPSALGAKEDKTEPFSRTQSLAFDAEITKGLDLRSPLAFPDATSATSARDEGQKQLKDVAAKGGPMLVQMGVADGGKIFDTASFSTAGSDVLFSYTLTDD